jgi:hypothetical protein
MGLRWSKLLIDSFTALVTAGMASLDRVAQDGVRVRARHGALRSFMTGAENGTLSPDAP